MIKTSLLLPSYNGNKSDIFLRGEFQPCETNKTVAVYIKSNASYGDIWEQKLNLNVYLNALGEDFSDNDSKFIVNHLTGTLNPFNDEIWVVVGERTDDDPLVKWVLQVEEESGPKPVWMCHFDDEFIYP